MWSFHFCIYPNFLAEGLGLARCEFVTISTLSKLSSSKSFFCPTLMVGALLGVCDLLARLWAFYYYSNLEGTSTLRIPGLLSFLLASKMFFRLLGYGLYGLTKLLAGSF